MKPEKEQKENRERLKIRQHIVHNLIEVLEIYTGYTVAEHLSYLADKSSFYKMTDSQVLKEIERYRRKLEEDKPEDLDDLMDDQVLEKYTNEKLLLKITKHGSEEAEFYFNGAGSVPEEN